MKVIKISNIDFELLGGKIVQRLQIQIGNRYIIPRELLVLRKTKTKKFPHVNKTFITFKQYVEDYNCNYYSVPINEEYGLDFNGKLLKRAEARELYDNMVKKIIESESKN